jgi:glutamine synthetase
MNAELAGAVPSVASIDFPSEGELVFSPHYGIRITASGASAVDVSLDAGDWQACRPDNASQWWYDWTGYGPGAHVVCARITRRDGTSETLRPRALRVTQQAHAMPGMQHVNGTETAAISRAFTVLRNMQVQFVQLWFTDLAGKPWRICLPLDHMNEAAFTAGITLDGPSTSLSFPSYINLLPDPNAIFKDPLATIPTAAIICDLLEPKDAGVAGLGVRQILRSAVDQLSSIKSGLTATLGAEAEFFLLEQNGQPTQEEDLWDFVCDLCRTLGDSGIRSEGFRFGPAAGQGRVQMRWADPVRTADQVILYRSWARVLARRRGKVVTFQPQPQSGEGAASMPVHHSLWLGNENAFHDVKGWQQTSDNCRWYVGGILKHAGALSSLVAPTAQSYPNRAGSQMSVIKPFLSATSPNALCRVPERQLNAGGRRIKFRAGNANANPYLSFAATILAGIDGMRKQTEPAIDETSEKMPSTLAEALEALNTDREFLKAGRFDDRLINAWIAQRKAQPERSSIEG